MTDKILPYVLMAVVFAVFAYFFSFKDKGAVPPSVSSPDSAANLQIEDIIAGSGAEAKSGDLATVHYVGALADGAKFDSSYDRGQPFQFTLGAGQVIKGWDLGVLGMKTGGKRKLVIPAELGYGNQAVGPIPANSVLIFEVELLEIEQP